MLPLVAVMAAVLATLTGGVTLTFSYQLPARDSYLAIEPFDGKLLLSGVGATGSNCVWRIVSPEPAFRIGPTRSASCSQPPIGAHPVVPVLSYESRSNRASVRIVHPGRPVHVSPIVMTFNDVSDTKLESTYGPGRLWLYDVAALHDGSPAPRAVALAISTTTGRVMQTASMPRLVRPLLAADSDGLWIAASSESGTGPLAPTYFLASGAHAPRLVHRGGYAAFWLAASGHRVWEDIASTTLPNSTIRQEIWRYDGSSSARPLASADNLEVVTPALQPGATALWTVGSPEFEQGKAFTCTDEQVVKIDAFTGRQTVVATIHLPESPCDPEPGAGSVPYGDNSQAFVGGAFYFLVQGPTQGTTLYHVQP